MNKYKLIISLFTNVLKKRLRHLYFITIELMLIKFRHKKALSRVNSNHKIRVFFFLLNVDTWKYHSVYLEFKKNLSFDPIIVICPFVSKGKEYLENEFLKSVNFCLQNNYNFIKGYDIVNKNSIDVKKIFKPEIVFFSNPNLLTTKEFLITNYKDTLTCYISYSFRVSRYFEYEYNVDMLNKVWLNFCESKFHLDLTKLHSYTKGYNTIISGYPQLDNFSIIQKESIWKKQKKNKKKIIWAPHWTIPNFQESEHNWSSFLDFADFFLFLSDKFKDEVQFAIKPHPFLRPILEQESLWGKQRTDNYFNKWNEIENCQVVEGEYVNLFIHSDAMIHDSGGFMAEYIILNKPIAYTLNSTNNILNFNDIGQQLLNYHDLIYSKKDLIVFIENVILGIISPNKINQPDFVNNNLVYNNRKSSENIVSEIKNKLKIN